MQFLFSKKEPDEEHNSWMSFTDLMSGFLVVFIIASVAFYQQYTDVIDKIKPQSDANLKNMINEYRDVFKIYPGIEVYAEFNEKRGSIALRHTGVGDKEEAFLFVEGRSEVQGDLEKYLEQIRKELIQKTIQLWGNYSCENVELRIEGHTNPKPRDDEYSFVKNLELSSDRANNVYKYLFDHSNDNEKDFIRKNMISVGYSYSRRLNENNQNDESLDEQSKTIEFRIITK